MNLERRMPERFIAFECFDKVMKHAERVFEMASQMKDNEPISWRCGTWGCFVISFAYRLLEC